MQRGKTAEIHDKGAEPEEMDGDPVQFDGDGPDVFGPFRHLDAGGLFHGQDIAMTSRPGRER